MNQRLMPWLVSSPVFVIIIFSIYVKVSSFIWPLEGSAKCQDTGPWGPKQSLIRVISFCFGVNKFLLRYNKDFFINHCTTVSLWSCNKQRHFEQDYECFRFPRKMIDLNMHLPLSDHQNGYNSEKFYSPC